MGPWPNPAADRERNLSAGWGVNPARIARSAPTCSPELEVRPESRSRRAWMGSSCLSVHARARVRQNAVESVDSARIWRASRCGEAAARGTSPFSAGPLASEFVRSRDTAAVNTSVTPNPSPGRGSAWRRSCGRSTVSGSSRSSCITDSLYFSFHAVLSTVSRDGVRVEIVCFLPSGVVSR